jgi:enoyl-CoA hydratase
MTTPLRNLRCESHGDIRLVTIDRPEKKNALSNEMRSQLCELLAELDVDDSVRAVVLTGEDPVFTAGVDFTDIDPAFNARDAQFSVNPGRALRAMTTPVICAVNGACVSGGLEIALSATFIVASTQSRFADTHARLGVVPTWGLTALLPRAIGVRRARELSITGNFIDAATALQIGLVNHVVAHDELIPFSLELANQIASTPAVGEILSLYRQGEELSFHGALGLEASSGARRRFDAATFAKAGRHTSARQRTEESD